MRVVAAAAIRASTSVASRSEMVLACSRGLEGAESQGWTRTITASTTTIVASSRRVCSFRRRDEALAQATEGGERGSTDGRGSMDGRGGDERSICRLPRSSRMTHLPATCQ